MKLSSLTIIATLSFIFSCSQSETVKYKEQMLSYLENEHSIKTDSINNSLFLIINLNCLDCLGRNNIEKLVSLNNKELNFIFVGKTHEKRILQIIKLLERKNKVIYDDKTRTKFYELNFSKAILFDINEAKIQNYIIYSGLNINKTKKDIQTINK